VFGLAILIKSNNKGIGMGGDNELGHPINAASADVFYSNRII
jgi:hypothetical protein